MYEKEAAHRYARGARENCMDRAMQTGKPLLSYEAEQWQSNLPELGLSTRLILGKAGVKRQIKDWSRRLFQGIVSQTCFTEIAFGTSAEESVTRGESLRWKPLMFTAQGLLPACCPALMPWTVHKSCATMQVSWCFSSYMSQSCQVCKSGIWLQVSLAALQEVAADQFHRSGQQPLAGQRKAILIHHSLSSFPQTAPALVTGLQSPLNAQTWELLSLFSECQQV